MLGITTRVPLLTISLKYWRVATQTLQGYYGMLTY